MESTFKLGVVEGFFGSCWSWQARKDYADFLLEYNFNTYIYAPKSDRLLRQNWHQPFSAEHQENLVNLAQIYRQKNLNFGIGLSPFELYKNFNKSTKQQLKIKLEQLNEINPNILCILFDDMHGDFPLLAQNQIEITHFIVENSLASEFVFCPSYYSDDPRLVSAFGAKPKNYLEDIGALLDPQINIFWTGPNVFSKSYPKNHLIEVSEKLKRKPMIWDNYPVNDAERLSHFLHLAPFEDNSETLKEYASGHLANPMNQAYLSQLSLYSLSRFYTETSGLQYTAPRELLAEACSKLCPADLAKLIMTHSKQFQFEGLSDLSDGEKEQLTQLFSEYQNKPMANEILDWLKGRYIFDPACLT